MKYRIETIDVPEHGGPALQDSKNCDLKPRRIIHVFGEGPGSLTSIKRVRVLTEEDDADGMTST